jgi:hypothetical protein
MLEMKLKSEKKEKENKHAIHTVARFFFLANELVGRLWDSLLPIPGLAYYLL